MSGGRAEETALRFDGVTAVYRPLPVARRRRAEVAVLQDLSFTVRAGSFTALVGPSGSGKSTVLKLAAGILRPRTGRIEVCGGPPGARPGEPLRASYMPQRDSLLPWRTLLENAVLPLELRGTSGPELEAARRRARELLPVFGLEGKGEAYPAQLSGGERQRAAFLRTVLAGGRLLLLDEPFGALDALTRRQLQLWLAGLRERLEATLLLVTHDVREAAFLADEVLVVTGTPIRALQRVPVGDTTLAERRVLELLGLGESARAEVGGG
ncbi:MAG: ATP-binding cassette domain-containing protein [Bacillota bacterium]|nr:ATP-binding cassette domain-containing protein [Bacillota bacterium]